MNDLRPYLYGLAVVATFLVLLWLPTAVNYRITAKHLKITFLGIPVRRIRLTNIEHVSKHHVRWAEQWWNTWRPFRRRLLIRRHKGLVKNIVITPQYRYEFKSELERAIQRIQAPKEAPVQTGTAEPAQRN
jgi:hypothetical protein